MRPPLPKRKDITTAQEDNPSPLVQLLQRAGFPKWGFVIVRVDYSSESTWANFLEVFDRLCNSALNEESGRGLSQVKENLEFKTIEDPRLESVDYDEVKR